MIVPQDHTASNEWIKMINEMGTTSKEAVVA